jgi:hypothetical protein
MKTFFVLVLTACVFLFSAQADVPAPKPVVITLTNLAAFPKYKFSYRTGGQKQTKSISDNRAFSLHDDVQLLVQGDNGPEQEWHRISYDWKGAKISLKIEAVKQDGKTITVTHKTTSGATPPGKKTTAAVPQTLPLLALTGFGACGLVLLARRRKAN